MSLDQFSKALGVSTYTVFSLAWQSSRHEENEQRVQYEYKQYLRFHAVPAFVEQYIIAATDRLERVGHL